MDAATRNLRADYNCARAVLLFAEEYPNEVTPSRSSFSRLASRFLRTGFVQPTRDERVRPATGEAVGAAVIAAYEVNLRQSIRSVATNAGKFLSGLKMLQINDTDI